MRLPFNSVWYSIKDYLIIIFGLLLYALGWVGFLIPNEITTGGVTGISALIYYGTGIPISVSYFVINVLLLLAAIKVLGLQFCIRTIFSVIVCSSFLSILPLFIKDALVDEHVIKICEGGSRDLHWLGLDGYIYETGSGGAAYWGISRLHFNPLDLEVDENTDWGSNGFVEDEFIGYLGSAVHINGSSEGIGDASQVPDSQISEDECSKLIDEWETRQVDIDWLRMSDYMMKHSLSGV